ncbi:E3 ubiquitin-protein ligase HUWE1 [Teleopsis dalmanni]|uniref:E3 ubiquitin-protein ligase HUWE1 n=1 Tax=Teleopsis dalmanni TaxID=139649 RepID=UPI0018CF1A5F|nr:E3 ubiquitin-protein ligase HUWE1 [Teleopsis dalmanni]
MVKKWFTEFRCGRTSSSDAKRSGRPKEVITPEIVGKIHEMILDDRRMKVRKLAHAMRIAHRACLVSGFNDYALRLQFVQARLQAISVLIYSNALYDNVDKILYPGFGEELCELIDKEDVKLVEIRAAVLRTLTSILHFDRNPNVPRPGTRLPKIIQYTGAEQQGGILPSLVRDCIFSLTENGSSEKYPLILATSLFSLLYHLASYETGGQSLIKSGMMQILLHVIGWIGDDIEHITFVTRAVRVVDLITNIDIVKFHQCNGLNIFIDRLDKEVKICKDVIAKCHNACESNILKSTSLSMKSNLFIEHEENKLDDLENMETNTDSKGLVTDNNSKELKDNFENGLGSSSNCITSRSIVNKTEQSLNIGEVSTSSITKRLTCITQRAALLKSMLNFLKKSIQDHAHFNGMRNIMESSLPCALRHIISNAEFYGPSLFLLATDVVTVYVFNEPSLLSSLQDLGITNVILRSLLQKDVPATREVLGSLPNVFSALCLNERGLIEFMSYNPFDKLLKVLLSPNYLIAMRRRRSSDPLGDTATNLGNAMDDLMKHHPYLRSDATEAIVRLLNELVRLGTESHFICWRANKEITSVQSTSQNNRFTMDVANTTQNDAGCLLEATENQNESSAEDDDDDEEMSSTSQHNIQSQNRSSMINQREQSVCNLYEREAIPLIDYIINVMKFIEAIFSNSSNGEYCKEFVLHGGLNPLLRMLSLPNLPVDSPVTTTAQAVANVCKSILNLTHETLVIDSALQQLSSIMNKLTPLTEHFRFQSVSVLLTELINCPKIDDGFSIANYTPLLHRMSSVHGYVVMLVNLCRNSSNEMRSMLLKRWGSNCEKGLYLLQNLVKLYISLVWESTILLSLCSDDGSNNADLNCWENYCLSNEHTKDCGEFSLKTNFIKTKLKPEEKLRYVKSLLAASSRLGRALAELFGTLVKLSVGTPQSRQRRNNDYVTSISSSKYPTHDAKEIARVLSSILVNGLTRETSESVPKLKLTFLICSVGFTGPMLFDDKRSSFHLMISQFCEENGLKAFFDMFFWALSLNCQSSFFSFEQCCTQKNILENSEYDVKDFPDSTGEFLDAWLQLLEKMINPRSILESPYSISKRFPHSQESVQFEPIFYLIQMHRLAIQIIKRIWQKKPIANFGISMTETMINIIKHIIKSHTSLCDKYQLRLAEIKNSAMAMEQCKQTTKADMRESTINGDYLKTLIDMGFSRDHVIKALRNTRSLEQATEYLLNHSEHEILIPLTRETERLDDDRRNSNVTRDIMDIDISECADLPCSSSNIAKSYFFNVNLISHDTIKQFCEEAIERSFSFMEQLPETIPIGSELIAIIFRHFNHEDKQTFVLNIVKQLNECVDTFVRSVKTGCDINIDKFEEYLSDSITNTLFIRLKVTILLLDEIYADIRKDICAAMLKEHTLNSLLLLLTKTEALLQKQLALGVKPTPPRWLQYLFELIDIIDSVSLILQRKSNMRAVSTDTWKWYDASTGKWNSYSEPNNTLIKNAFNTGERSVSINIGRQRYTINFNCMTQVSEASGSHRPVLPVLKITQALNTFCVSNISNKIESVLTRIIRSKTDGRSTFHQDEEIYLNSLINFDSDENSKDKTLDAENDKNMKIETSQSSSVFPEDFNNHVFISNNVANMNKYKERNEKKTFSCSFKRVQKIVLNEENIGLAKYDSTEIIKCCVRLLNPLLLLNYEVKQSILKLCARLTREFENAKLFYRNGGLNILLNMHQPCNVMGYPTYAIVIIRHMVEAPAVLQESMERIIASRTFQSVPVGHRDLTFVLTQISSAVGRHPSIFLAAAKQILQADYINNPISSLDDSRFLVKSQSIPRKCNLSTDKVEDGLYSQISTNVIKDILNSLIQPCIHYTKSSYKNKSSLFHSQVTEVLLSPTGECSIDITKKNTKKIEWCCCSWHTPSSGHTHLKPLLPRATLMKALADTIRSYQSTVPRIIIDHRCYPTDSILIKKEQSFLSFILDNYLPIVNRGQDSEVCVMSRVLILSLSDCCGQPYIQTKVVEEIQDAIIRTLSIKDPYIKNRRVQILVSLFPMMIENPMQANKIHTQRNNMNRILLRKGIMTILSKLIQYKDLSNSNILLTMYSILKPMEMLLRLTVAPGSLSSKRILIGTSENPVTNRRVFPRLTTRLSSNSGSIGGENVLRDIIRNVLSDRRHGFDFIFNADDLLINPQAEDISTLRSTGGPVNNENMHSSATTNHRPQVTFDRLWDDLLQNENLRLLNQNSNLNITSAGNNTASINSRFHNANSEPSNNENRRNGGSDGASSSSETVAVVADNATSLAEVSTSESDTDSNISSENDDQNDEDDDEDDNEDEANIDGVEDPNDADADDDTRQFIEVFDHIYEPESSEATSNDADIDADDEASEIITRSNIIDHNMLTVRNTRLGTTDNNQLLIRTEGQNNASAIDETIQAPTSLLSNDSVLTRSIIHNNSINFQLNSGRTVPASVLVSPRLTHIDSEIYANYRDNTDEEINEANSIDISNNVRLHDNTVASSVQLTQNNPNLMGSTGQRREQSRRLIYLDQQYCISMPSVNNPLDEGQIEVFNQDALHWWLEEAKLLDLESQTDACLYTTHFLKIYLIKHLQQMTIRKKSETNASVNCLSSRRSAIPVLIQPSANMPHEMHPQSTSLTIDVSPTLSNAARETEENEVPLNTSLHISTLGNDNNVHNVTNLDETIDAASVNADGFCNNIDNAATNENEQRGCGNENLTNEFEERDSLITENELNTSFNIENNSSSISESTHNVQNITASLYIPEDVSIEISPEQDYSAQPSENNVVPSLNRSETRNQIINEISPEVRAALGDLVVPDGVDPSFLAALPSEMREEVIQEHLRMQRSRQRAQQNAIQVAHDCILEVNPEFLAALPPNIQSEVLLQQRIEQQRQAAQSVNPDDPVDAAAFFQNLPDSLRQTILTDMEESQMASLPPDLAAEAQNLRREWESRNNSRFDNSQSNTLSK